MKWLHNLLKASTLTTALFIFQACYGMPQGAIDGPEMAPMTFTVVSEETGLPLKGITITESFLTKSEVLGVTDADGKCSVMVPYVRNLEGTPELVFEDPENVYASLDTVFNDLRELDIVIKLATAE